MSSLTENDFLMAREREDGHIYFVGGLVAFPGMYSTVELEESITPDKCICRILPLVRKDWQVNA